MGNDALIAQLQRRAEAAETRLAEVEVELDRITRLYQEAVRHLNAIYDIIQCDWTTLDSPKKGCGITHETQDHRSH